MGRKTAQGNGKAAELARKLTPEEKTALVCGRSSGSKEIIGAAAVTVPGAAGETTASLLENTVLPMSFWLTGRQASASPPIIRKIRRTAVFTK